MNIKDLNWNENNLGNVLYDDDFGFVIVHDEDMDEYITKNGELAEDVLETLEQAKDWCADRAKNIVSKYYLQEQQ